MIGVDSTSSAYASGRPGPMLKLYQHIFPACFRLACSQEVVAKQLFEPLVFQIIHWFTNRDSSETQLLLTCIVDALSNRDHGGLRELGARMIAEFYDWSTRQVGSNNEIYEIERREMPSESHT